METLRQMREFALEACALAAGGNRQSLESNLGFRRHAERIAERIAELIGESATRLPSEFRDTRSAIPWKQMIGMRNWLIHGYDGIDADILWDVLSVRARELAHQIDEILRQEEDHDTL